MIKDSAVITSRNPDTVRAADVAFYSFERLPNDPLRIGSGRETPDLVVEVRSASDRWVEIHEKVGDCFSAGVTVVLDPRTRGAHVFQQDEPPRLVAGDDEVRLSGALEGVASSASRFFE